MIETHVVNALILPSIKEEPFHKVLTFINGLVAPTFLFCAGFAFAISLHRKRDHFSFVSRHYWRYLFRLLFILVVGYSLHLPFFSLSRLRELHDPQTWLPFFQADILQTISVSLFMAALVAAFVRSEAAVFRTIGALALIFIFAAPVVREADLGAFPAWLTPYLTMQVKTQFPLFPWAAFLLGGAVVGMLFIRSAEKSRARGFMKSMLWISLAVTAASLLAELLPVTIYPHHDFWKGSPEFFFVRFGIVLIALWGLWQYEQKYPQAGSSPVSLFGQESLLVYVVHLLVVYGYTYEYSFIRMFGPTLRYPQTFGLFAALALAMYALAYGWHSIKRWNRRTASYIQFAVLAGIVVAFVLK